MLFCATILSQELRKKERETQQSADKSENDIKALQSVGQIVGEVWLFLRIFTNILLRLKGLNFA